jgi:hypothetical protein
MNSPSPKDAKGVQCALLSLSLMNYSSAVHVDMEPFSFVGEAN